MYDIIIIGAGVSGLSAAIYARRANKKVLVLEKLAYGGQILNALDIENYPANYHISGYDLATNIYNQAIDLGIEYKIEKVEEIKVETNIKKVITNNNIYETKSMIIASGLTTKKLRLENEDKYIGKGISYCATCDGSFYKDKIVAIVGGGNSAVDDAIYLSNIAKKVFLIHRREKFRADKISVDKLYNKDNIEIILNTNITKIIGDDHLKSLELTDNNFNIKEINVDALFIAIGKVPESQIYKDIIDMDEEGFIISNEELKTNIEGIFVCGDIRKKNLRQLTTAVSDGSIAATSAINYLN